MQTLEPLTAKLGLGLVDEPRLAEGTPIDEAMALIMAPGPAAAMSTHGDIIVGLVNHLIREGLTTPAEAGGSKASAWQLEIDAGEIKSALYLPPPK